MWLLDIVNNHNGANKEFRSFGLAAKYCFKIWVHVFDINVLCIVERATLGAFIGCKNGKAKTGTAVDAGNFRVPCRERQSALGPV